MVALSNPFMQNAIANRFMGQNGAQPAAPNVVPSGPSFAGWTPPASGNVASIGLHPAVMPGQTPVANVAPVPTAAPAAVPAPAPGNTGVVPPHMIGSPVPLPPGTGMGAAGRPDLSGYIPQGFAQMLSHLMQTPQFQERVAAHANQLARFGLTPEQVLAQGFDPNQLYTRQMAMNDYRGGRDVLPAGMVPQGYQAPDRHNGWGRPLGMQPPTQMPPVAQPQSAMAPIGLAPPQA